MATDIATIDENEVIENALIVGDLAKLTTEQRVKYYNKVCDSLGLNPLTQPFEYVVLNGKLRLYARRDAADQLRKRDSISIGDLEKETIDDLYVVTAHASTPSGRTDTATGVVSMAGLKGQEKANAMMKTETKAKRRVTLSICGLGWLDETEVEDIPTVKEIAVVIGEVKEKPRMVTTWSGKEYPAEDKLGTAIASTAKFESLFVSQFNHPEHFTNHIQKHFKVDRSSDLTWEMAVALHKHLYDKVETMPWYPPEPKEQVIISGWDAGKQAEKLYVDKGFGELYNSLHTHMQTVLGSINGNIYLKAMTEILTAVSTGVYTNPPTDSDIADMKATLDNEFRKNA